MLLLLLVLQHLLCSTASDTIFCRRCGTTITTTAHHHNIPHSESSDVTLLPQIALGAERVTFRNPTSISYDVVTFKRATNIIVRDNTHTTSVSFYPPYGWEPIYCKKCGAHVGWQFKAPRSTEGTCPLSIHLPPMRPPDLTGSSHPNLAAAAQKLAQDKLSSSTSSTSSSSSSSVDATAAPRKKKQSIQEMMLTLKGFCSTKQTGWWVYEWCFQKHVRQFHLEPYVKPKDGATPSLPKGSSLVTIATTQYLKNPDWSLGEFKLEAHQSKKRREQYRWSDTRHKGATKEPKFVSHLHVDRGQHCDETKDGRRTEVRLLCCDTTADDDQKKKENKKDDQKEKKKQNKNQGGTLPGSWNDVSIRSIVETSVCRYRLEVCVPLLCERDDFRSPSMKAPTAAATVPTKTPTQTKEEEIMEKLEMYQQSQTQCVFYGLIWPRLLLQNSPSYKWVASVTPIVGIRRER